MNNKKINEFYLKIGTDFYENKIDNLEKENEYEVDNPDALISNNNVEEKS